MKKFFVQVAELATFSLRFFAVTLRRPYEFSEIIAKFPLTGSTQFPRTGAT
jgi:hypothetical protein